MCTAIKYIPPFSKKYEVLFILYKTENYLSKIYKQRNMYKKDIRFLLYTVHMYLSFNIK